MSMENNRDVPDINRFDIYRVLTKEATASFRDICQYRVFREGPFDGKIRPTSLDNKYIVLQHRPRTVERLLPCCLHPYAPPRPPHTMHKIVEGWLDDTGISY